MSGLEPYQLAGADQELAQLTHILNTLKQTWLAQQPKYDVCHFDHLARIACFMQTHIRPQLDYTGAVAALAIAIHQLTQQQGDN